MVNPCYRKKTVPPTLAPASKRSKLLESFPWVSCLYLRSIFIHIIIFFVIRKIIAIIIIITRSYAALRAADLDWIVGPGYSSGRYIWRKTMKNQPGTMKDHENRLGTMKNDLEP